MGCPKFPLVDEKRGVLKLALLKKQVSMMIDGKPQRIDLFFFFIYQISRDLREPGGICVTDDAWISSEAVGYISGDGERKFLLR